MTTLVIYSSQTGFSKTYAQWLGERLGCQVISLEKAEKKDPRFFIPFDCLIYGSWAEAGKIHKSHWFISKIEDWKDKKLALFMVGASPNDSPDTQLALDNVLEAKLKPYARVFYCQGGLSYEKMSLPSKIVMKIFAKTVKKKNPEIGQMISKSYDISDPKYLDPLVNYIQE